MDAVRAHSGSIAGSMSNAMIASVYAISVISTVNRILSHTPARAICGTVTYPLPYTIPFGGAFHCATLDVRRRGGLQSYF